MKSEGACVTDTFLSSLICITVKYCPVGERYVLKILMKQQQFNSGMTDFHTSMIILRYGWRKDCINGEKIYFQPLKETSLREVWAQGRILYYSDKAMVTAIDISPKMLKKL